MKIEIDGYQVHVGTGGRPHSQGQPFIAFLHGSGNCHLTWISQSRALAYDGYNVIAPDMPGHNLSKGEPLRSIEACADWYLKLFAALECNQVVLVGHSQGGIIALEIARKAPDMVRGIAFIATAMAIPVNDHLIGMAENKQGRAIVAMTDWGHGPQAHLHDNTWPGGSNINYGLEVMALNPAPALASDLKACAAYEGGTGAASQIKCPSVCVFAEKDKMTPMKFGKSLAETLGNSNDDNQLHIIEGAGHMLPVERPRQVNDILRGFLDRIE